MSVSPCTCKAYHFPHRPEGGKCLASESGPFCGYCGQPCRAKRMDFGYGRLEYWGERFTHRDIQAVSNCCEEDVYEDASLSKPYRGDE